MKKLMSERNSGKNNPNYNNAIRNCFDRKKKEDIRKKMTISRKERLRKFGHTKKELELYKKTSKRMKEDNPVHYSEVLEKISETKAKSGNKFGYKKGKYFSKKTKRHEYYDSS